MGNKDWWKEQTTDRGETPINHMWNFVINPLSNFAEYKDSYFWTQSGIVTSTRDIVSSWAWPHSISTFKSEQLTLLHNSPFILSFSCLLNCSKILPLKLIKADSQVVVAIVYATRIVNFALAGKLSCSEI